jgi:DNA-binding transcriptional ArsR family regulator
MIAPMGRSAPRHEPLSPELVEMVAARFRILGEPIRIRILQALQGGEKTVGELVAAVGSTQPNVSKHLRILQDAGIVTRRQDGNSVHCRIADPTVFALCATVCGSIREQVSATARLVGVDRR